MEKVVLGDETLISVLNRDSGRINPLLIQTADAILHYHERQRWQRELSQLEQQIAEFVKLKLPDAATLDKLIKRREAEHGRRLEQLQKLTTTWTALDAKCTHAHWLARTLGDLELLLQQLRERVQHEVRMRHLEWTDQVLKMYQKIQLQVSRELSQLRTTLKEQEKTLTRLNDEVIPNRKELEQRFAEWQAVADGLSPTDGLPLEHITQYLNLLIHKTNTYIARVWEYQMELQPMPVGQPLDYNIPISVYGSEPLKDISICSDGQKAIIDFAFTLAILETRGIGMLYPILLDELDANLSESHRANLVGLLGDIIREEKIREFFLVNHFATLSTAIPNCEMVCLSEEGISLPPVYNRHVTIE